MDKEVNEKVLDKKLDSWTYSADNLITDAELTVTITLHEYRDLIKKVAVSEHEIKKAEEEMREAKRQCEQWAEKCETLTSLINGKEQEGENDE